MTDAASTTAEAPDDERRLAGDEKSMFGLAVLLGALTALGPLSIDMYLPAFPALTRDLGVEDGVIQLTLTIFLLASGLSQAFYGPISDRYGRRTPLLVGCVLYILGGLAGAFAPTFGWLMAARTVQGIGAGAGMVLSRAVVRDKCNTREAAKIFSLLMLIMGAAPILAPALGGQVLVFGTWRVVFLFLAAFGVACLVASALALDESLPPERRNRGGLAGAARSYAQLLTDRHFLSFALVSGCLAGIIFAYIAGSPFVYIELLHVDEQRFGLYFGANAVGLVGAAQINRLLLRRFEARQLLAVGLAISSLAGVGLLLGAQTAWGGFPLLAVTLFLCLFGVGLASPNLLAIALEPFAHAAGSASALLGVAQFGLGAVATALVGVFHNGTALPMTGIMAGCAVIGASALVILARPQRGEGDHEESAPFPELPD